MLLQTSFSMVSPVASSHLATSKHPSGPLIQNLESVGSNELHWTLVASLKVVAEEHVECFSLNLHEPVVSSVCHSHS